MAEEQTKKIKIINRLGLHVRAATQLVKTAEQFKSEVFLNRDGFEQVNGKSIMSVLTLAAPQGTEITFITRGEDAAAAMEALERLVNMRFGEES